MPRRHRTPATSAANADFVRRAIPKLVDFPIARIHEMTVVPPRPWRRLNYDARPARAYFHSLLDLRTPGAGRERTLS